MLLPLFTSPLLTPPKKIYPLMIFTHSCPSPLGTISLASTGKSLCGLWIEGQKHFLSTITGETQEKELPLFEETRLWLKVYFEGKIPNFTPKLSLTGTPFQKNVWELLRQIPYGQTTSYKNIAQELAHSRGLSSYSAQAVGGAVGRNPISLIIPCHRVIGSNGSLTGYAGGLEKKRTLLELEQSCALK